jgi:hypothetical protein
MPTSKMLMHITIANFYLPSDLPRKVKSRNRRCHRGRHVPPHHRPCQRAPGPAHRLRARHRPALVRTPSSNTAANFFFPASPSTYQLLPIQRSSNRLTLSLNVPSRPTPRLLASFRQIRKKRHLAHTRHPHLRHLLPNPRSLIPFPGVKSNGRYAPCPELTLSPFRRTCDRPSVSPACSAISKSASS